MFVEFQCIFFSQIHVKSKKETAQRASELKDSINAKEWTCIHIYECVSNRAVESSTRDTLDDVSGGSNSTCCHTGVAESS